MFTGAVDFPALTPVARSSPPAFIFFIFFTFFIVSDHALAIGSPLGMAATARAPLRTCMQCICSLDRDHSDGRCSPHASQILLIQGWVGLIDVTAINVITLPLLSASSLKTQLTASDTTTAPARASAFRNSVL